MFIIQHYRNNAVPNLHLIMHGNSFCEFIALKLLR
jgi:hypothetical protein